MSTKKKPSDFDGYAKALQDEPMFTLLARDPHAPDLIESWVTGRFHEILDGDRPRSDVWQIIEAMDVAAAMRAWRSKQQVPA